MKKILLLGHTGKVGSAIYDELKDDYIIIGMNSKNFDAVNPETIRSIIEDYDPDIVINAVAYSGMGKCEENPDITFSMNSLLPRYLAKLSNEKDFLLIHFSSESVFGNGGPYVEDDIPQPKNVYGITKYLGDHFIERICKKYYIFRLPMIFGVNLKGGQLIDRLITSDKAKVANDYFTTFTYNKDVAREIKRILKCDYEYGMYHITNTDRTSLYDFIKKLSDNVKSTSHRDFKHGDITSSDVGLITNKLPPLRSWKESIKEYMKEL